MKTRGKTIKIVIGIVIAAVFISCALLLLLHRTGTVAVVEYNGETIMEIPLSAEGVYHIDADLPVTLIVEDGCIFFTDSVCPDHLCEGFGRISRKRESAICLPARVSVYIK